MSRPGSATSTCSCWSATGPGTSVYWDDDLVEALGELGQSELSRGFVVDGDRLVGFLSITDVARVLEIAAPPRPRPG